MYSNYGGDSGKGFFHIGLLLHPIICVLSILIRYFKQKLPIYN